MSLFRRSARAKTKPTLVIGGENGTPFTLAVVNPGGRDPEQHFPAGAGQPEAPGVPHPPINFHAYAACTGGSFHTQVNTALVTGRPVLLLLRRDLPAGLRALRRLKKFGRTVAVAFKETGSAQLAARLTQGEDLKTLAAIVDLADGCLAPVPWMVDFLVSLRSGPPANARARRRSSRRPTRWTTAAGTCPSPRATPKGFSSARASSPHPRASTCAPCWPPGSSTGRPGSR